MKLGSNVKERPILFSTPMVQAILAGRKTQTRIIKNLTKVNVRVNDWEEPVLDPATNEWVFTAKHGMPEQIRVKCPFGLPGDTLWVRETWSHTRQLNIHPTDIGYGVVYKADNQPWDDIEGWCWKPSIIMTREASRINLKIKQVRVVRLHSMSTNDLKLEGIVPVSGCLVKNAYMKFMALWISLNGNISWKSNHYVWVIEFEVL